MITLAFYSQGKSRIIHTKFFDKELLGTLHYAHNFSATDTYKRDISMNFTSRQVLLVSCFLVLSCAASDKNIIISKKSTACQRVQKCCKYGKQATYATLFIGCLYWNPTVTIPTTATLLLRRKLLAAT